MADSADHGGGYWQTLRKRSLWRVREHSQILLVVRCFFYAGVVWAWPTIAWRVVSSSDQLSPEDVRIQYQKVLAWRWQIARLLVVYELVFPLNILATLGDWL